MDGGAALCQHDSMKDDGAIASRLVAFADQVPAMIAKARRVQNDDDPEASAAADELRVEYRQWYGEAIKLLDGSLRERFRAELEVFGIGDMDLPCAVSLRPVLRPRSHRSFV
ncbi:MAG: hypothetical protein QOG10_6890 [Kribbellaceae bacterium]|nr:hypothetical protein [Kribbellaceae bacterium]